MSEEIKDIKLEYGDRISKQGYDNFMRNARLEVITLFLAECDGADRKLIQDGHIWITWDEIKQIAAQLKGE